MLYTVKTYNKTMIWKKESANVSRPYVNLSYTVAELGLSGIIELKKEDYNFENAKAQVVEKIKAELVRLAEHKEYQIEV